VIARRGTIAVVGAAVMAAVVAGAAFSSGGSAHGPLVGPEGVPQSAGRPLAAAASAGPGEKVDRISCGGTEQIVFHVHALLAIFDHGAPRAVPAGIGIAPPRQVVQTPAGSYVASGTCFSFLHTHAADGIVHIEAPAQRAFTLGQFFDVWKQPLGRDRVGPAKGSVAAFVDGRRVPGDPRDILLSARTQIQLDVGLPAPAPRRVRFPRALAAG